MSDDEANFLQSFDQDCYIQTPKKITLNETKYVSKITLINNFPISDIPSNHVCSIINKLNFLYLQKNYHEIIPILVSFLQSQYYKENIVGKEILEIGARACYRLWLQDKRCINHIHNALIFLQSQKGFSNLLFKSTLLAITSKYQQAITCIKRFHTERPSDHLVWKHLNILFDYIKTNNARSSNYYITDDRVEIIDASLPLQPLFDTKSKISFDDEESVSEDWIIPLSETDIINIEKLQFHILDKALLHMRPSRNFADEKYNHSKEHVFLSNEREKYTRYKDLKLDDQFRCVFFTEKSWQWVLQILKTVIEDDDEGEDKISTRAM